MQCKATTKKGEPCRMEALEGNDFCRVHQGRGGSEETFQTASTPLAPLMTEGTTATPTEPSYRVRYKGSGLYQIGGHSFHKPGQTATVEKWVYDILISSKTLFEDA